MQTFVITKKNIANVIASAMLAAGLFQTSGSAALAAGQCDFPGSPDSASAIQLQAWATGLARPVEMKAAPGQDQRLYVIEQAGRIRSVTAGAVAPTPFLDIRDRVTAISGGGDERGLLGLAFHPQFATNGKFYVNYTTRGELRSRISEFRVGASGNGEPTTERILIELAQPYSNHNGGGLAFGPDGFLYIGFGDGGSANDPLRAGQDLRTLLAKMLRIDVNRTEGTLPYAIPADNPRFSDTAARREIFAYGLRNPWRISFDSITGKLWVGDVGQNAFEEVNVVEKGGNYGWNTMEGTNCFRSPNCNRQGLIPPVYQYGRSDGISITGGYVYRGSAIPSLTGAYLFADYGSGTIWGLRYDPANPSRPAQIKTLLQSGRNIVSFGQDTRGELYVSDLTGSIYRIVAAEETEDTQFPQTLSATGCFTSLSPLTPAAGLVPYDVGHSLWSDGAKKSRFIRLPAGASLDFAVNPQGSSRLGSLTFPEDTVLVKNFFAPTRTPAGTIRDRIIETRFLVKREGAFEGFTYRWNDLETEATLLADATTRRVTLAEAAGDVAINYYYPSQSDCVRCHTPGSGMALGFQPQQLNRSVASAGGATENQIQRLARQGVFDRSTVPTSLVGVGSLPRVDDQSASLDARARAYLQVNCAGCHNPNTTAGQLPMDFRATTPLAQTGVCNALPRHGDLGVAGARGILPGDPDRSLVYMRLVSTNREHRMPPVATNRVDAVGTAVVRQWISGLAGCQ